MPTSPFDRPSLGSWLNQFIPYVQEQFQIGEEGSPYQLHVTPFGEEFARFRLQKEGVEDPLIVDLAPGPMTSWGRSVISPSAATGGKYSRIFSPEIYIGGEDTSQWIHRSPEQAVANYMREVWDVGSKSSTTRGKWSFITGKGAGTSVGSLQQFGPVHSAISQFEMASRVSIGFAAGVRDQSSVWKQLHNWAQAEDPFYKYLRGYAPWKGDDNVTRLRNLKATGQVWDSGDFDWTVYSFGSEAAKAVKHASVSYMGGLRETVDLMRPSEGGGLEKAIPGFTTSLAGSAGYRLQNIAMPGQGPIATVNRPGTAVTPAAPIPGAMISFEDVLQRQGIYGAFREGRETETLVTPHIRELAKAKFQFGQFRQRTDRQTGDITYEQTREGLGGMIIPANQSAIVGLYSYQRGDRTITQPITVTAEGREIAFDKDVQPELILPAGFIETTGEGHPGVLSPEEQIAVASGLTPYTNLSDPHSAWFDKRLMGALHKAFPGSVKAVSAEKPFINIPTMTRVGMGAKSLGVKAGIVSATGIMGQETPRTIRVGDRDAVINAVLGEVKNPLPAFVGMMGAMPGTAIAQSLTELFPEAPKLGTYAARQARQQMDIAQQVRRGMLTQQQGIERWTAVSQEMLAGLYSRATGRQVEGWRFAEEWRQRFMEGAQMEPGRYMETYGYGIQRNAQWLTMGPVTPDEREFYSNRFMRGLENLGITGDEAQQKFDEYYRFKDVEGTDLTWWQMKSPLIYQTIATPVVPEDLWKNLRLGYEERASLNLEYGRASVAGGDTRSIADFLGLAKEQGPMDTGFMPPHAKAWRTMGELYSYQFSQTDKPMIPPSSVAYKMTPLEGEQLAARIEPGMSMAEYEAAIEEVMPNIGGRKLMYHTGSRQTMVRPSVIEAISEYEGADADMVAINRSAKQYFNVLQQWSEGGTYGEKGPMGYFAADLRAVAEESGSKTLSKTLQSRWLREGLGGRFSSATGMGLSTIVMSQERMDTMLQGIGKRYGISPERRIRTGPKKGQTQRFLDLAREQVEAAGGLPGLIAGQPFYGRVGGLQPVNIITPEILKQRGVTMQEASRFAGGQVISGGTEQGGILAAFGPEAERLMRDIDLDPGFVIPIAGARARGRYQGRGLQIPNVVTDPMMAKFQEEFSKTAGEKIETADEILNMIGGGQGPGGPGRSHASSGYISAAQDIVSRTMDTGAFEKWLYQPGVSEQKEGALYEAGEGWVRGKTGMGVAYNFRRWIEASMGALGFSEEEIGLAHTWGGKSYASFLEQTTKEEPRNLETFMNSLIVTSDRSGIGAQMMAKPQPSVKHMRLPTGASGEMGFHRQQAFGLLQRVRGDKYVQPEFAAALFSRPGSGEYGQMLEQIKGGADVYSLIEEKIKSDDYDIGMTPIGLTAGANLATRLTGELSGRPYQMLDPSGGEGRVGALDVLGADTISWRGEQINLQAFTQRPEIQRTSALFQSLSRRGGVLRGEQIGDIASMLIEEGGDVAPQIQDMYRQLKAENYRVSMATGDIQKVLATDFSQLNTQPVLHPSMLGLSGVFQPGQAGIASEKFERKWGRERQIQTIAEQVFKVPRNILDKAFPSTFVQEQGHRFEEWAGPQLASKYDLAYTATGAGSKGTIAMQSQRFGMRVSFQPDVIGVVPGDVSQSGAPELFLPDIKHSAKGKQGALNAAQSRGYGLQLGAYASFIREAAETKTPEQFQGMMEPYMRASNIPASEYQETARAWQGAALNRINTGVVAGYTTDTGEFAFAAPDNPMIYSEQTDWTNPQVQTNVATAVGNVASWFTPESIREIAPNIMGAIMNSEQWNAMPIDIRNQIRAMVNETPGPRSDFTGTNVNVRVPRGGTGTPASAGGAGGAGGNQGGGGGIGMLPPFDPGSDEFNNYWSAAGRAMFGGDEGIKIDARFTGGQSQSDFMKMAKFNEGVQAISSAVGRPELIENQSFMGFTYDRGVKRWRGPTGQFVSEQEATSGMRNPRLWEIDRRMMELSEQMAGATGRARGGYASQISRLRKEREQVQQEMLQQYYNPESATGVERFPVAFREAASEALGTRVSEADYLTNAGDIIGTWYQKDPESFRQFYTQNKEMIKAGARDVAKAEQAYKLLSDPMIADVVPQETRERVASFGVGLEPASRAMGVMKAIQARASAEGMGGAPPAWMKASQADIDASVQYLDKFGGAIEKATEKVLEHSKVLEQSADKIKSGEGELTFGRQMGLARRIQQRQDLLAGEREFFGDVAAGRETISTGDLRKREAAYATELERQQRDISAYQRLQEETAPKAIQAGRLARRALGGWGLMYMQAMFGLPFRAAGYGYQASEQYLQQQYQQAAMYGGDEVGVYQSPEQQAQWSQIAHGGTAMAQMRRIGAQVPAGVRDIAGVGLAGIAGAGMATWLGGVAGGTLGASLIAGAPVIGAVAAGTMAAFTGMSYAQNMERTMPSYAIAAMNEYSSNPLVSAGGQLTRAWMGAWLPGQEQEQAANVSAYALYAQQGISPEEARRRGLQIPSQMMPGQWVTQPQGQLSQQLGIQPGVKYQRVPGELTPMTPEQEIAYQTAVAGGGQFQGMEQQAAAVLGRWGSEGLGTQYTLEDVANVARSNFYGADTAGLAAQAMRAFRGPQTQEEAGRLEREFAGIRAPWQQAQIEAGLSVAQQLPRGFIEATPLSLYGEVGRAQVLDRYARGPNAEAFGAEVTRYQLARQRGETYEPNLPGTTQALPAEERLRREDLAALDTRATEISILARRGGLDQNQYYNYAMRGQVQATLAQQAVSQDITAQIYGMDAGAIGGRILQGGQQQQLAEGLVGMLPQMNLLGMQGGYFQTMALGGVGQQGAVRRMMNMQSTAMQITGRDISPLMQEATQAMGWQQGTAAFEMAMNANPFMLTSMAQGGAFGGATFQGQSMNYLMAQSDINMQGQMTGLAPLTTSLTVGDQSGLVTAANAWSGGNISDVISSFQESPWRRAATLGLQQEYNGIAVPEYLQGQGGMRALQWVARQAGIEQQQRNAGNQLAMLELQGRYQPMFWDIQDRQTDLQNRQAQWGFQFQERQFALQGTQFMENMQFQRQQQLTQRGWTQEDWGFQDQQRAMQWGWRQEDFEESVRFMSGRQRKLAERSMERETIMHGMEGDQIDRQRERQKEIWAMEDERHNMTIEHFQEQRQLQEENMKKQQEFYAEGKKLREEQTTLQREYWKEMHALQLAAAGANADYAETLRQIQDDMEALRTKEEDRQGQLKLAQSLAVDFTNTIIDGLNYLIREAPGALRSIIPQIEGAGEGQIISPFKSTNSTGGSTPYQTGGDVMPGQSIIVGDRGPEVLRLGTFGSVMSQYDLMESGNIHDRWSNTIFGNPQRGNAGQAQSINVYIGNEKLADYVVRAVKQDLEVA